MKRRWIGITGLAFITTALLLGLLGPSLWPSAFWNSRYSGMIGPGMMSGGMIGPGMMNGGTIGPGMMSGGMMGGGMMSGGMMGGGMMSGGMMSGGMMNGGGMMGGEVAGDSGQPFDQRFLDQMIMHHQGAVMSAQMMIADSARPELRDLAQRIIAAQQREIAQMQQWRNDWYGASSMGTMPGMMNGGMMNRDQMRQMMGANADFDRMFLQMMIPHHEGAISMAQQALDQAEHPEIKALAQSIVTAQQTEIVEMQGYLRDWYGVQGQ